MIQSVSRLAVNIHYLKASHSGSSFISRRMFRLINRFFKRPVCSWTELLMEKNTIMYYFHHGCLTNVIISLILLPKYGRQAVYAPTQLWLCEKGSVSLFPSPPTCMCCGFLSCFVRLSFAYIEGAALSTSFQLWGDFWKNKNGLKAQGRSPGKDRKMNKGSLTHHVHENWGHITHIS